MIELLVVISIIALLIAILLPALGKARQASDAVLCASNLKQLGAAAALYAADNRDYVPRRTWYAPWPSSADQPGYDRGGTGFRLILLPYLNGGQTAFNLENGVLLVTPQTAGPLNVFRCPRNPLARNNPNYAAYGGTSRDHVTPTSYSCNGYAQNELGTTVGSPCNAGPSPNSFSSWWRFSQFNRPAHLFFITESLTGRPDMATYDDPITFASNGNLFTAHPGGNGRVANFVFADFHVAAYRPTRTANAGEDMWQPNRQGSAAPDGVRSLQEAMRQTETVQQSWSL